MTQIDKLIEALSDVQRKLSWISNELSQLKESEQLQQSNTTELRPEAAWFRPSGHLSDIGVAYLYRLFDDGCTVDQAASRMGISHRGAAGRRATWLRERRQPNVEKDK